MITRWIFTTGANDAGHTFRLMMGRTAPGPKRSECPSCGASGSVADSCNLIRKYGRARAGGASGKEIPPMSILFFAIAAAIAATTEEVLERLLRRAALHARRARRYTFS